MTVLEVAPLSLDHPSYHSVDTHQIPSGSKFQACRVAGAVTALVACLGMLALAWEGSQETASLRAVTSPLQQLRTNFAARSTVRTPSRISPRQATPALRATNGRESRHADASQEYKDSLEAVDVRTEKLSAQDEELLKEMMEEDEMLAVTMAPVMAFITSSTGIGIGIALAVALAAFFIKKDLDTPSRTWNNNVGDEYDAWTKEEILEYYWGEHIHLGYYNEEERKAGYKKKDFIQAKYDFIDEMLKWGTQADTTDKQGKLIGKGGKILDVGCGIGGTSRYLANAFPEATVKGITLSGEQVKRGTQLASEAGLPNVSFEVMNALAMDFPDNTFDMVWACESGEHMPDKKKYIEEMTRVLKPGGKLIVATWCQREETPENPLSAEDKDNLQYLYEEWAHPYFISKEEYARVMDGTGELKEITTDDWVEETIPSWRHSVWVGVYDPWPVIKRPYIWYKTVRDIVCLERMHRAFDRGLMEYGMLRATKQ